jgi:hypothetical protein
MIINDLTETMLESLEKTGSWNDVEKGHLRGK